MRTIRSQMLPGSRPALALIGTFCLWLPLAISAQSPSVASVPGLQHTPYGVEASSAAYTLRVDALRPDVLRVRLYPAGHPAEDASWAVFTGFANGSFASGR